MSLRKDVHEGWSQIHLWPLLIDRVPLSLLRPPSPSFSSPSGVMLHIHLIRRGLLVPYRGLVHHWQAPNWRYVGQYSVTFVVRLHPQEGPVRFGTVYTIENSLQLSKSGRSYNTLALTMSPNRSASAVHAATESLSASVARLDSAAHSEWPYPKATRPPSDRALLVWSKYLQQHVFIFNEIFSYGPHTAIPKRTVLYSARKPPRLFIANDTCKAGAPPARRGSALAVDRLWPLYQPEWLRFCQDEYPAETCHYKQPELLDGVHSFRCEIDAQELFRRQPSRHPNLPLYLGCAVDSGYVVEIVFKSYACTLADMVDRGAASDGLWRATVLSQLKDVTAHQVGLAQVRIVPKEKGERDEREDVSCCISDHSKARVHGAASAGTYSDPEANLSGIGSERRTLMESKMNNGGRAGDEERIARHGSNHKREGSDGRGKTEGSEQKTEGKESMPI
ncbi:hypothetical protein EXIGLDRAFT_809437 [Exidia glandulosa HHB12029]|uniref:Uncharacterized protein n=1 Tax=Exidia glandulosa HHB12029 TaxID=1314781 RepID=A0A165CUT2_EXIGL|nr:hypothetical protein EXIGLDRAFT_809437 [Exidia glandulosa HHB12029]